mgnify:CR=1 FL=1
MPLDEEKSQDVLEMLKNIQEDIASVKLEQSRLDQKLDAKTDTASRPSEGNYFSDLESQHGPTWSQSTHPCRREVGPMGNGFQHASEEIQTAYESIRHRYTGLYWFILDIFDICR